MPSRTRLVILLVPVIAALVLAATACKGVGGAGSRPLVEPGEKVSDMVLTDLEGRQVRISELIDGKVALVDVWATWCIPCIQAMPHLQSLYNKYRDRGLVVVGIMTDSNASRIGPDWVRENGVTYPMLLDDDASTFVGAWGQVVGIPLLVLVDRDGTVVETYRGTGDLKAIDERLADIFGAAGGDTADAAAVSAAPAS